MPEANSSVQISHDLALHAMLIGDYKSKRSYLPQIPPRVLSEACNAIGYLLTAGSVQRGLRNLFLWSHFYGFRDFYSYFVAFEPVFVTALEFTLGHM